MARQQHQGNGVGKTPADRQQQPGRATKSQPRSRQAAAATARGNRRTAAAAEPSLVGRRSVNKERGRAESGSVYREPGEGPSSRTNMTGSERAGGPSAVCARFSGTAALMMSPWGRVGQKASNQFGSLGGLGVIRAQTRRQVQQPCSLDTHLAVICVGSCFVPVVPGGREGRSKAGSGGGWQCQMAPVALPRCSWWGITAAALVPLGDHC